MRDFVIEQIRKNKVIAIIRGASAEECLPIAKALYRGGIRLMEITYNQKAPETWEETARTLRGLVEAFRGKMIFGAGTVVNPYQVSLTAEAGGEFIVSPNTNEAVIAATRERGLVSVPGAMTPTEILAAHDAGADFVKLFPAGTLGIPYLKAICAPLGHIEFLATTGITADNAKDFLDAGAKALGIGGALADRKAIEAGEYEKLTEAAEKILAAIRA